MLAFLHRLSPMYLLRSVFGPLCQIIINIQTGVHTIFTEILDDDESQIDQMISNDHHFALQQFSTAIMWVRRTNHNNEQRQ